MTLTAVTFENLQLEEAVVLESDVVVVISESIFKNLSFSQSELYDPAYLEKSQCALSIIAPHINLTSTMVSVSFAEDTYNRSAFCLISEDDKKDGLMEIQDINFAVSQNVSLFNCMSEYTVSFLNQDPNDDSGLFANVTLTTGSNCDIKPEDGWFGLSDQEVLEYGLVAAVAGLLLFAGLLIGAFLVVRRKKRSTFGKMDAEMDDLGKL